MFGVGGISKENLALAEGLGNAMRDIFNFVSQPVPEGGLDEYLTQLRQHLDDYTGQLNALKHAGADEAALSAIYEQMIPLQQALLEGEAQRAQIRAADAAKADEMLATLEQQLHMNQLIAEYGKESLEVRQAELDAEYEKQVAAIEGLNITDEQKDALYDALSALHDNESQTLAWASAMALVNAELQGAYSLISSMGGTMIMNAQINAAKAVREAGGSALEARRAGEIAGRKQEILNGRNIVGSEYFGMSDGEIQGLLNRIDIDAAQQDEWSALITDPKKERKKKSSGRKKSERLNGFERAVSDIQSETEAYLRQADAIAQIVAVGGDWEHALAVIEEEQKLLNAAQKAGVKITPEVTQRIKEMAEAHVTAEETLERMRTATERGQDAFKDLFGSILEGSDSAKKALANLLMEIAKVQFAKSALGLLGSTSWGGDLINTVGSLLSFDGGGDTPSGSRSGGLDGNGGFLAMLHPNETVIDHTKNSGSTGGAGGGTVIVRATHDPGIILEVVDSRIGAHAPSIQQGAVQATRRSIGKSKSGWNL